MQNFARVWSTCYSPKGLVEVEIQILVRKGMPRFDIIGLPQNMIREGKDRILASLYQMGVELPSEKILVHLNPGDLTKEGSHLDLPILFGILQVLGLCATSETKDYLWGELQLDGKIQSPENILPHLLYAEQKTHSRLMANNLQRLHSSLKDFFLPQLIFLENASDLFRISERQIKNPKETLNKQDLEMLWINEVRPQSIWNSLKGSREQFLFWCLASLGRWNCLIQGSPGVGKSTWCLALDELQRPLPAKNWSQKFKYQALDLPLESSVLPISKPAFEMPHHTSSSAALVGGGSGQLLPGAITRADRGILFLDELPEFHRDVLEALREPLESGYLSLARRGHFAQFPARIQLLAAMNPCKCGGGTESRCRCSSTEFWAYRARISEAFRDRFHHETSWAFVNKSHPSDFSLREVKVRLIDAERKTPKLAHKLELSPLFSPRRQRLWLQMLHTWAQWMDISEIHSDDFENLQKFLNQLEEENEIAPKVGSFPRTRSC